jgi:hypothetical protein
MSGNASWGVFWGLVVNLSRLVIASDFLFLFSGD